MKLIEVMVDLVLLEKIKKKMSVVAVKVTNKKIVLRECQ